MVKTRSISPGLGTVPGSDWQTDRHHDRITIAIASSYASCRVYSPAWWVFWVTGFFGGFGISMAFYLVYSYEFMFASDS